MVKYGFVGVHSTNSIKKSAVSVGDICSKAKEMGASTVALADETVMTGVPSFVKAAKKAGIKPVVGTTLFVEEDGFVSSLEVYAKNTAGYGALLKAMFLTNKNIGLVSNGLLDNVNGTEYPLANMEILAECFGPASEGYGNVYAVSGGMKGIVGSVATQNQYVWPRLQELELVIGKASRAQAILSENEARLASLSEAIQKEQIVANQKPGALKKELKKLEGSPDYEKASERVNALLTAIDEAKARVKQLRQDWKAVDRQVAQNRKSLPDVAKEKEEYRKLSEKTARTPQEIAVKMAEKAEELVSIFGKGNFFLGMQYHGMQEEDGYMQMIDSIAFTHGIPTCAGSDPYMKGNTHDDITGYETMLSFFADDGKVYPLTEAQKTQYLMDDAELSSRLAQVLPPERIAAAMEGTGIILNGCNMAFGEDKASHYPVFQEGADAYALLIEKIREGINHRFPDGLPGKNYVDRLNYEVRVMKQMGVCDYHLIVQDMAQFGRKLGHMPEKRFLYLKEHIEEMGYEEIVAYVDADQSQAGYTVGPGRGSAAGSLVCYLLQITDIDPIVHSLIFERYLNPERATMPDIDVDYANGYREVVIAYTYKRYGEDMVCRIMTVSTLKPKATINDVARLMGEQQVGSYLSALIPGKPGVTLDSCMDNLTAATSENAQAKELLSRAISVENAYRHYGMHAAGVVISGGGPAWKHIPLMWDAGNHAWKSQYDMVAVEEAGLLKMDCLGLKNLNMVTEALRLIADRHGIVINPDKDIREEKDVILGICASGKTNSVFQLESAGMKDTIRLLKPDCFEDLVLLVAAYRPGPMDSIPDMCRVKHGGVPQYRHPKLEPILKETYGSLIYQEQVQQVFRELAGYPYGRADLVRRAMSKKHEDEFLAEKPVFIYGDQKSGIMGCVGNGIPENVASAIFDDMVSFSAYAFNKSHAAAYARVSYMLAWLKYHYPIEFMTVALNWAKRDNLVALMAECREMGITVAPVDINRSEERFSIDDGQIRFGLTSVKGIGSCGLIVEERKKCPFSDLKDFLLRTKARRDVTVNLIDAGAFDGICLNRRALGMAYAEMAPVAGELVKCRKSIDELYSVVEVLVRMDQEKEMISGFDENYVFGELKKAGYKGKTIPSNDAIQEKINTKNLEEKAIIAELDCVEVPVYVEEDLEQKLRREKELLGVFQTGHPLDAYQIPASTVPISSLSANTLAEVCGVVTDLSVKRRTADGAEMAFFDLDDKSGVIHVACFTAAYNRAKDILSEGAVIRVKGKVESNEKETAEGEDEIVLEIRMSYASALEKSLKKAVFQVTSVIDWNESFPKVSPYIEDRGEYQVLVYDRMMNEFRETGLRAGAGIKNVPGILIM